MLEQLLQIACEKFRGVVTGSTIRLPMPPAVIRKNLGTPGQFCGDAVPDAAIQGQRVDEHQALRTRLSCRAEGIGDGAVVGSCESILFQAFFHSKLSLDRLDVWFAGCQRDVPCIVAVQPARILVSTFHPGVGAGNGLDVRGAGLAMSFIALERVFEVFWA